VNVKGWEACTVVAIVSGWEVNIDAPLVQQTLALELEFLNPAMRCFRDPFELGRIMKFSDEKERVLAADTVVDVVMAERIEFPLAVNDELVFEPRGFGYSECVEEESRIG
jgi:hypothetical protein